MPTTLPGPPTLDSLKDLTRLVEAAEGFPGVVAALLNGHSATIDGAWGSSAGLAAAALGLHAPRTLLIALAHPRDVDGWSDDLASFAGLRPLVFPAWDHLPEDSDVVDEVASQRLRLLKQLESTEPPRLVLTTIQALIQPVPDRAQLIENRRLLQTGSQVEPEELAKWLVNRGYRRGDAVELPGEFSRRGGIFDIYSPDADAPYRLEFFGDEIESIRQFSPQTQRSLGAVEKLEIVGSQAEGMQSLGLSGHLCDYLPSEAWIVLIEPTELHEQGKQYLERVVESANLHAPEMVFQRLFQFPSVTVSALPAPSVEATCHLRVESVERFSADVTRLRDELDSIAGGDRVLIACHNEAEGKRLAEVLAGRGSRIEDRGSRIEDSEGGQRRSEPVLVIGRVRKGFRILTNDPRSSILDPRSSMPSGIVVLSDHELFHREEVRQVLPRRRIESRAIDSFLDLAEGDLIVHVTYGIGRYRGMKLMEKDGNSGEHLILEFRDGAKLYVPATKIDLVQKYVGGSRVDPELSKLGGTSWQRKKARVQEAVFDLASEMIQLQALREAQPGIAYPPDSEWQAEFEAAFPYEETPDQLTTLGELKRDMERSRPMDRLICGDVGYGKTELAIRAAFKTIDNGRQVAVLVPTTVLAEQHFRTFSQRLAEYPFVVDGISRFRTAGEQKRILQRLAQGGVDVIIGTHRLLSADVQFKDLGLVIIDEEQRFGVEHKERLKKLRQTVDVLTMTATPIPRTLHLSLLGIRDISNLETPPADRLAIETRIARWDPQLIRQAILRELNREGQIFFVHNRVHNIQMIADKVKAIVPEARICIGHGQMPEHELEQAMVRFVQRDCDILVATTIIESGLDIPNANTIFINEADIYGLADLHQLRGRVGRYKHRAYAYLLLDPNRAISPTATRRLKAIEEFTELGAGFKIALRDLEIRGAGNILGPQQSGHIAAVGYEMYCQLLENAVRQLKNQPLRTPLDVSLDLPWPAFLPRDYVTGHRSRIEVYRRLARIRKMERLEDFRQELRDRFGPWPESVDWLLRLAELRLLAARWQVATLHFDRPADPSFGPTDAVLGYRSSRLIKRVAERSDGRLRVVNANQAYFRLLPSELEPSAMYATFKHLLRLPERKI